METEEQANKRFLRWLERLQESITLVSTGQGQSAASSNGYDNGDGSTVADLCNVVSQLIRTEEQSFPAWITRAGNDKLASRMSSTVDDVKTNLRHIVLPHALHGLQQLRADMPAVDGEGLLDMESIARGPLMGLSRLADVHHRLSRAMNHDGAQVQQWLTKEQKRETNSAEMIRDRTLHLDELGGMKDMNRDGSAASSSSSSADEVVSMSHGMGASGIDETINRLKSEMNQRTKQLMKAEEEEERARKVYENAVRQRRKAMINLSNVENVVETVMEQRQTILRLLKHRIETERFNATSATGRIELFQKLSTVCPPPLPLSLFPCVHSR